MYLPCVGKKQLKVVICQPILMIPIYTDFINKKVVHLKITKTKPT